MKLNLKHPLSAADAAAHVRNAIQQHRTEIEKSAHITEERWEDNMLNFAVTVQGQAISGTLTAKDKEYEINVKLPLMLRLFEGKIKKAIEQQAGQVL